MNESLDGAGSPIDGEGDDESTPGVEGERITRGTSRTRGGEAGAEPDTGADETADADESDSGAPDDERITRGTSRTRGH